MEGAKITITPPPLVFYTTSLFDYRLYTSAKHFMETIHNFCLLRISIEIQLSRVRALINYYLSISGMGYFTVITNLVQSLYAYESLGLADERNKN